MAIDNQEEVLENMDEDDLDALDDGSEFRDDEPEEAEDSEPKEAEASDTEEETEEEAEEESEEEAEEESEEEAEEEAEEEPKGKKDIRIPKDRFDEVNNRLKEERRRNEELERRLTETREGSEEEDLLGQIQERLDVLDDELSQAIIDADTAKVKTLRVEERRLMGQARQIELEEQSQKVHVRARYELLVDQIEEKYPQYNPKSEDYDADLAKETNDLRYGFLARGYSPEEALQKAIKYVYPQRYPETESESPLRKEPKSPKRSVDTPTQRNKKVAKSQPADVSSRKSAVDSNTLPDISKMTDEEVDNLPPKVLARLQGDFLDEA